MLEAHLKEAAALKRLIDAIKELVTDANFECTEEGIKLQAMDNSHVALVTVELNSEGFVHYRCDHPMPLGVNLASLAKVLKCAKDDDRVAMTATDAVDVLKLTYEAKTQDRVSEYEIKLMDIDQEALGIPETEYDAKITLSSGEFARICRDLQQLGESVRIEVSKEGVRFISEGDAANGSIHLRPAGDKVRSMAEIGDARKVKKEKVKVEEDEDAQMVDDNASEDDAEEKDEEDEEGNNDEEDDGPSKKRKRSKKEEPKRKTKKAKKDDDDEDEGVVIAMSQHVSLTFSLKYLANFSKSGSLSNRVSLSMSNEVPLLVSYHFGQGKIEYYLAPKIGDE